MKFNSHIQIKGDILPIMFYFSGFLTSTGVNFVLCFIILLHIFPPFMKAKFVLYSNYNSLHMY